MKNNLEMKILRYEYYISPLYPLVITRGFFIAFPPNMAIWLFSLMD